MNPTIKQALHFFALVDQKGIPDDQLQVLYQSGLVSDLLDADVSEINREEFRRICGLKPFVPELKIWKTIKLGLRKSPAEYRAALKAAGYRISDYADQILDKITVAEAEVEVDLVRMTVAELGFKGGTTRYDAICKRIVEIGGQIDESGEVGPALREQYPDQHYREWNAVAMKAITGSGGVLRLFSVGRGLGGRWLYTYCGGPDSLFCPGYRVVFAVPRK